MLMMPNRYSDKVGLGLRPEGRFGSFGRTGYEQVGCIKMACPSFGLSREGGFGTWHGVLVNAPHLERWGLLPLNWAANFSLALKCSTVV